MALEQWEIDLRRQLEGKAKSKDTWEEKLVEEIKTLPRNTESPKDNNTILMLVLLIILGGAMLFAYDSKSGGRVQSWLSSLGSKSSDNSMPIQQPSVSVELSNHDVEIAALRADIQRVDADNKAKLDKLTAKVQWNSDRLTLMGILLNENFMIVRNNYSKGHLIFFNRDWTLDQMPHYLELSDADKEYLNKFVKPSGQ